jgi:hypothetical protein
MPHAEHGFIKVLTTMIVSFLITIILDIFSDESYFAMIFIRNYFKLYSNKFII